MPLATGTHMGPYEIVGPLGAGGRGEVYRARDIRLERDVAVKILRAEIMTDADRRRFEIEARALSSISHPNILAVYDVGEEAGTPFMISELLDGDSLRSLIPPDGLQLRKLLDIAVQVADGLAAAHAHGITHRDLKPENIIVLRDGRAKILDFGLAHHESDACGPDDTRSLLITSPGAIVGTLAYLSPEQAQGLPVDYRADQFAFGLLLYEMAAGRRAFERADRVSTLSAIVKEEPAPLTPLIPAPLRWIIDRCLAKDPAQRYVSTADLYQQLRDLRDHVSEVVAGEVLPAPKRSKIRLFSASVVVCALVAGFAIAAFILPQEHAPDYTFVPFATDAVAEMQPAWSPDARTLAYVAEVQGTFQVFARNVDSSVPVQITTVGENCSFPSWSPDGTRVFYQSSGRLWSVGATGGAPQELLSGIQGHIRSATVSPDGKTVAFFRATGQQLALYFQSATEANPKAYDVAPFPPNFRFASGVEFAPNGRKLLAGIVRAINIESAVELWVIPYPGGAPRRIPAALPGGFRVVNFSWMPDNRHIAFSTELTPGSGTHLYSLDSETGRVAPITSGTGEERQPAVSPGGMRIAFVNGTADTDLVEISRDGTAVAPLLATSRREFSGEWSPSGHQFLYLSDAAGIPEIWLRSPEEAWAKPVVQGFTQGTLQFAAPRFSPDSLRIAYSRIGLKHLVWIANASGGREVWLEQESSDQHAPAWSPDGKWIAYFRYAGQKWELAKAPSGGGGRPIRLCDGGGPIDSIDWSPSGDWIAYSDQQGLHLVTPDGGTPRVVHAPVRAFTFTRDGSGLYVARRAAARHWELMRLSIPAGTESRADPIPVPPDTVISSLRLHPDGLRFVATIENARTDIWMLEGFSPPPGRVERLGILPP